MTKERAGRCGMCCYNRITLSLLLYHSLSYPFEHRYTKQLEGRFNDDDDDDDESSNIKKIKATSWSEWIELERRRTQPERRVEFKTLKPFLRTKKTKSYDLIFQLLRMYGVEVAWRVSSWNDVYSRDRIGREEYRNVVFF